MTHENAAKLFRHPLPRGDPAVTVADPARR